MKTQRIFIRSSEAGRPLFTVLAGRLGLPPHEVRILVRGGRVRVAGKPCLDPRLRVQFGQRFEVAAPPAPKQTAALVMRKDGILLRHVDDQIIVVSKPAGITTMRHPEEAAEFGKRAQRFLPDTVADLLPEMLAGGKPGRHPPVRPVHRLDKETSGLVVFARTPEAERHLGRQFRDHTVERRYLALVRGRAVSGRIESWLVRDRGDGRRGSGPKPGVGQRAVTHIRVVEELGDFTLVECRLETGRTHQVRIHLGEAGTPLCGERVYDRPLHGKPLPDASCMKRPALHAVSLGFTHPTTGKPVAWTSPLPLDMNKLLGRLRNV